MDGEAVEKALEESGVRQETVSLLRDEELLDEKCLRRSMSDILRSLGLKGGQILAIKNAFPSNEKDTSIQTPTIEEKSEKTELLLQKKFSPRVQEAIRSQKMLDNVRNEFLRDVCDSIRQQTLFPTKLERETVALKIVGEYPFIKDAIGSGIGSIEQAIAFRFKNLRKNKPEHKEKSSSSTSDILTKPAKRLKLAGPNALPDIPSGETEDTFKDHMKRLQKEMTKTKGKNQQLIKTLMDATFAMRRREIVQNAVSINDLLKRFPALTLTSELKREFGRISQVRCKDAMDKLRSLAPNIVEYGQQIPAVKNLISNLSTMDEDSKPENLNETIAILVLARVLKDKRDDMFLKVVDENDDIDKVIAETTAPRIVAGENRPLPDPIYIVMD
ncbi:Hypothetical predicted protein, partial [Paramuricea clavata]